VLLAEIFVTVIESSLYFQCDLAITVKMAIAIPVVPNIKFFGHFLDLFALFGFMFGGFFFPVDFLL